MNNAMPVVELDTRQALTDAFNEGKVRAKVLYRVKDDDVDWQLDISQRGFVEVPRATVKE